MRRQSFDPPPPPGGFKVPEPPPPVPEPGSHRLLWWGLGASGLIAAAVVVAVMVLGSSDEATTTTVVADGSATSVSSTATTDVPETESTSPGNTQADTTEPTIETTEPDEPGQDGDDPPVVVTVTGLTATISPDRVLTVAWSDPGDETGYTLTLTPGTTSTLPADVTGFEHEPIPCGTPVTVELIAHGTGATPVATGRVTAAATACPPDHLPPSNLRVTYSEDWEGALIEWDDATGEVGYVVNWQMSRTIGGGGWAQEEVELDADVTRTGAPVGCQGHLEVALEAIAPDGSHFGRLSTTFDGPRCNTWDLVGSAVTVQADVVVPGSGLRTATAECPAQQYLVGGGFNVGGFDVDDAGQHPIVIGNRPVGNGWRVTVAARPGRDVNLSAFALCIAGKQSQIIEESEPGGEVVTVVNAMCPAGTNLTGGGWWADPFMQVSRNEPLNSATGWHVQADGEPFSAQGKLITYAVCVEHVDLETILIQQDAQIPAGGHALAATPPCPAGSMLTGGGFAVDFLPFATSMPWISEPGAPRNDIWNVVGHDSGESSGLIRSYAVCLAVG